MYPGTRVAATIQVKPEWEPVPAGGKGALLSAWPQGTARNGPMPAMFVAAGQTA